jgi:hypothetical protein
MKTLLALGLLPLGACYHPKDWDPAEARSIVPVTEPVSIDYSVATPTGPGLQYMVLQVEDARAITPWLDSLSVAQSAGREWGAKRPDLGWYILWRHKPDADGRP